MAIVNEQKELERVRKNIESGNTGLAKSRLNNIKKQAQNRVYYLNKKMADASISSAEKFTVQQQLQIAKKDLSQVKSAVNVIKKSIKDPQHVRTTSAFNKLNLYVSQRKAEQNLIRKTQSQVSKEAYKRGTIPERANIITIRTAERLDVLMTNLLLENPEYSGFTREKLEEWAKKLEPLGVNLFDDVKAIFKENRRYNSGDEFEGVSEIISRYSNKLNDQKSFFTVEQIREFNAVINEIRSELK